MDGASFGFTLNGERVTVSGAPPQTPLLSYIRSPGLTGAKEGCAEGIVYRDGSVQVNHGGVEMGQGLHTKIREIAARRLGVRLDAVRVMATRTDKVLNTAYFAYGAAVTEVEIDGFTGSHRILRADLLEDVGDSVAPLVDLGQIEGGFVQGAGWLTLEELLWDANGRPATDGASTYKLPSWTEMPEVFHVAFLERASEPGVVFGSKATGEPPLMLAISVREAIRDAIRAFGAGGVVELDSPATPERIFFALEKARVRALTLAQALV